MSGLRRRRRGGADGEGRGGSSVATASPRGCYRGQMFSHCHHPSHDGGMQVESCAVSEWITAEQRGWESAPVKPHDRDRERFRV